MKLQNYLDQLYERKILKEEVATITTTFILLLIAQLAILITSYFIMLSKSSRDYKMENKIKDIVSKNGNKLSSSLVKIRLFDEKEPNAFCATGTSLFYTKGLKKLLTEKELIAVLLHEHNHFKNAHSYIKFCYRVPLIYLVLSLIYVMPLGAPMLYVLAFMIMLTIGQIPYDITVGRLHEYSSDTYAVKLGYGEELKRALLKMQEYYKKRMEEFSDSPTGRAVLKLNEMIDEHPTVENRIKNILKKKELYQGSLKTRLKILKNIVYEEFKMKPEVD